MASLEGRIALVTGASRGIGYWTALALAKQGAHVIAVARTSGGLEELDDAIQAEGGSATLVPMDLTDMPAIDRLGGAINDRWGKLDILVANAGVLGTISPVGHFEAKVFDKVMAVNVTANYRLIRSTDLLLRQAMAGRAVFVSSSSAKSARPFWGLYAASKAAVDAMVKSYSSELEQTKVKVNVFYPGAVRTAMRAKAMPGEDPDTLPKPADIAPKLVDMISPGFKLTGKLYDASTGATSDL